MSSELCREQPQTDRAGDFRARPCVIVYLIIIGTGQALVFARFVLIERTERLRIVAGKAALLSIYGLMYRIFCVLTITGFVLMCWVRFHGRQELRPKTRAILGRMDYTPESSDLLS